jgi:hypothetical protein
MSGPWEEYAQTEAGPWNDYAQSNTKPATRTSKILKGVQDPIDTGAQLLTHILPEGVVDAGNDLNNFIADKTGLVARLPTKEEALVTGGKSGVDGLINQQENQYQDSRMQAGETGIDGYRLLGNVVSPANLALASKLPAAGSLAKNVATGVAGGAGLSVLTQPVVGDKTNYVDEKIHQAKVGAVTGGLLPVAIAGGSRVISPNASKNAQLAMLKKEGVDPTIGQTLGGRWNSLEQKLGSIPVVGDLVNNARGNANSQFERATYNKALAPLGIKIPDGLKGREALAFTESTLRDKYDDTLIKIGAVTPDRQFKDRVSSLEMMVKGLKMPEDKKLEFEAVLDTIKQSSDNNGVMTSQAFKDLEGELGAVYSGLNGSKNVFDRRISPAIKQVQQELRDMLERQSGPLSGELKATNKAYAIFKRAQRASSALGAPGGEFTPSQLQNAVKALDRSKDKGAFGRGDALLQDWSESGKVVLGNNLPNSGTADRMLLGGAGLAAYLEPSVGVPVLASSLAYTKPGQKTLGALLSNRPKSAGTLAELLRKNGNYVLPASSTIGLSLSE